jgi:WD40 repeat protein
MEVEHNGKSDRDQRLDEAVTRYLEAAEAGTCPDRRAWLDRYPDLVDDLAEFFADLDHVEGLTAPYREAARTVVRSETPAAPIAEEGFPFGDFQILREIGRGGMGVVYRARQRSLNRLVALKMIRSGAWATDAEVQRFRNEAEAAGGLDHPNIVAVYEVGFEQGQLYYTMRLVEGSSLAGEVPRFGDDPRRAARLMATVAQAVHHAHQRGVLHRDLKPSNILLDASGVPHVTDFGLAKRLQNDPSLTQTGALVGTPSYMAPELAVGRKGAVSTASDVFSLGAVLYTLLAGEPPFRGDTPLAVLEQVRCHDPPPLARGARRVDVDLETIVRKCLEKDPQARYASAAALADDLERWRAGMPIEARPVGRLARAWRWSRRNRLVASLLTATITLLIVTVVTLARSNYLISREQEKTAHERDRAREGELVTRQNLYVADMQVAWNAWRSSSWQLAQELLARHVPAPDQPDLRGFEWRYLHRRLAPEDATLRGHTDKVFHVSYSPDGTRLATASNDGTIRLWDAATCRELCTFVGHRFGVNAVSFSPDSQLLASAGDDGTIRLWDLVPAPLGVVDRWRWKNEQAHKGDALEVEFSPSGKQIASGGKDGLAKLWDAATGSLLAICEGHTARIENLAFSPDGKLLATAGEDCAVQIWAVPSMEGRMPQAPLKVTSLRRLNAGAAMSAIAFSPDGRQLAVGGGDTHEVRFWNPHTGGDPSAAVLKHLTRIESIAFSADGRLLASSDGNGTIKVLDLEAGNVQTLPGHVGTVFRVAFAPRGQTLASAGADRTARIWNLNREPEHRRLPLLTSGHYRYLAFSPDGKLLATADVAGAVRLWEVATWRLLRELPGPAITDKASASLSFSPDAGTLAVGIDGKNVRLWNVTTGRLHSEVPGPPGAHAHGTFSADGRILATWGGSAPVVLWDVATMQPLQTLSEKTKWLQPVSLWSSGKQLAGARGDTGDLLFWDSSNGEKTMGNFATGKGWTPCLAHSPDGTTLVTGNGDGTVAFWDTATQTRRAATIDPLGAVVCAAFSPDAQTLATFGGDPPKIRLWNVATAQDILTLDPPWPGVRDLAFSPRGDMLAATVEEHWGRKGMGVYVWTADPAPAPALAPRTPPQP